MAVLIGLFMRFDYFYIVTSIKDIMFLPVSVYLSVNTLTCKVFIK